MTTTYSATLPANPSPQLQTVLKFIEAGTKFDRVEFTKYVTDDYLHIYLPGEDLPTWTTDEFFTNLSAIWKHYKAVSVDVKEIIEAPGVVTLYLHTSTTITGGTKNSQDVLYLAYVSQQADGSYKVTKSKQFIDTAKWKHFAETKARELAASASV